MEGVEPIYAKHVREQFSELQRLFDVGEAVQGLEASVGYQAVLAVLDAELSAINRKLDGPNPLSHVEYTHLHGQRRGLLGMHLAVRAIEARYVAVLEEQERKHERAGESAPER